MRRKILLVLVVALMAFHSFGIAVDVVDCFHSVGVLEEITSGCPLRSENVTPQDGIPGGPPGTPG